MLHSLDTNVGGRFFCAPEAFRLCCLEAAPLFLFPLLSFLSASDVLLSVELVLLSAIVEPSIDCL